MTAKLNSEQIGQLEGIDTTMGQIKSMFDLFLRECFSDREPNSYNLIHKYHTYSDFVNVIHELFTREQNNLKIFVDEIMIEQ